MPPEFEEELSPFRGRKIRKRRRQQPEGKLFVGRTVEVRSVEAGLLGSWYLATLIASRSRTWVVRFDRFVAEDGCSLLEESVPIPEDIDGCSSSYGYRGRIRPLPPSVAVNPCELIYGLCVDVNHEDGWWEGVIFDKDMDALQRKVFFPDQGDELVVDLGRMRICQDWNECNDSWVHRGVWSFLKVIEQYEEQGLLPVSVRQIWYDVRGKEDFKEIKEWTSRNDILWEKIVLDTIAENFIISALPILPPFDLEREFGPSVSAMEKSKDSEDHVSSEGMMADDHGIIPQICPPAVSQYFALDLETCKGDAKMLRPKVKNQLKDIGWKFSYRFKGNSRCMVYESPWGRIYHSLRSACNACIQDCSSPGFKNCRMEHVSADDDIEVKPSISCTENSKISENLVSTEAIMPNEPQNVLVDCPEAVYEYHALDFAHCKKATELRLQAKDQLLVNGWKIFERCPEGKSFICYESPQGKLYYSLRQACAGWVNGGRNQRSKSTLRKHASAAEEFEEKYPRKRLSSAGCALVKKSSPPIKMESVEPDNPYILKVKKLKISAPLAKLTKKMGGSRRPRVQLSSKKAQNTVQQFPHNPKTVLSWLIDKNILLPRAKVQCRGGRSGYSLAEGRIQRDGIKCSCCNMLLTIDGFVSHCGGTNCCAAARIFLDDGRSIQDCEVQILLEKNRSNTLSYAPKGEIQKPPAGKTYENDFVCSVCQNGGDLILCDECPSSFHTTCLGLKDVPDGDWYCPSCCCGICGQHEAWTDIVPAEADTISCYQCACKYHTSCLRKIRGIEPVDDARSWYCSKMCEEIHIGLLELEGKQISLGKDNLTFTLLRPVDYKECDDVDQKVKSAAENFVKLNIALDVIHECFEDMKDPHSRGDLVEDVIFNRTSELNRLNFQGFYTVLLERNGEVVTVAVVRIHGTRVVEVPLIGTRFQYRRQGMCHAMLNMLEKILKDLKVEQIVLAAAPSALNTWTGSFGFSQLTDSQKSKFVDKAFLCFHDTIMCGKRLPDIPSVESRVTSGISLLNQDDHLPEGADIYMDAPETAAEEAQGRPIAEHNTSEQAIPTVAALKSCDEARTLSSKTDESSRSNSKRSFKESFPESSVTIAYRDRNATENSTIFFGRHYKRRRLKVCS